MDDPGIKQGKIVGNSKGIVWIRSSLEKSTLWKPPTIIQLQKAKGQVVGVNFGLEKSRQIQLYFRAGELNLKAKFRPGFFLPDIQHGPFCPLAQINIPGAKPMPRSLEPIVGKTRRLAAVMKIRRWTHFRGVERCPTMRAAARQHMSRAVDPVAFRTTAGRLREAGRAGKRRQRGSISQLCRA
jgi:hypothetical protein